MIRDTLLWINETLFYLTGGIQLIDTLWIFPWVLFGGVVMVSPILIFLKFQNRTYLSMLPFVFLLTISLPVMLITISPGAIQSQMMKECKTVDGEMFTNAYMNGKKIEPQPVKIRQCRFKEKTCFKVDFK